MSDKTFETSDLNKVHPDTVHNLALSLGALIVVVVAGYLLYSIIADRMSEAATGPVLAIFPVEEAERYSTENYAPVRVSSQPEAARMVISPIEEAERFSPEWYAWQQGREETTAPAKALAIFPVEEAERFSPEWYAWQMERREVTNPVKALALFPVEEAERYSSELYAQPRAFAAQVDPEIAISPIEEAERFSSEWYQWRMKAITP